MIYRPKSLLVIRDYSGLPAPASSRRGAPATPRGPPPRRRHAPGRLKEPGSTDKSKFSMKLPCDASLLRVRLQARRSSCEGEQMAEILGSSGLHWA